MWKEKNANRKQKWKWMVGAFFAQKGFVDYVHSRCEWNIFYPKLTLLYIVLYYVVSREDFLHY